MEAPLPEETHIQEEAVDKAQDKSLSESLITALEAKNKNVERQLDEAKKQHIRDVHWIWAVSAAAIFAYIWIIISASLNMRRDRIYAVCADDLREEMEYEIEDAKTQLDNQYKDSIQNLHITISDLEQDNEKLKESFESVNNRNNLLSIENTQLKSIQRHSSSVNSPPGIQSQGSPSLFAVPQSVPF
jgi:methyl-accepting chemotaxis protein